MLRNTLLLSFEHFCFDSISHLHSLTFEHSLSLPYTFIFSHSHLLSFSPINYHFVSLCLSHTLSLSLSYMHSSSHTQTRSLSLSALSGDWIDDSRIELTELKSRKDEIERLEVKKLHRGIRFFSVASYLLVCNYKLQTNSWIRTEKSDTNFENLRGSYHHQKIVVLKRKRKGKRILSDSRLWIRETATTSCPDRFFLFSPRPV